MSVQMPAVNNQALQQAELLFQQNRWEEAEELYQSMLNANFMPGIMHFRLGMIANWRRDFDKAISHYRDAFQTDPTLAAKILPQGSPLQQWIPPTSFSTVEVKSCPVCGNKKQEIINVVNCLPMPTYHTAIDPIRVWVKCQQCNHGYVKERPSDSVLKEVYNEPPPVHLQMWNYNQLLLFSEILHALQKKVPNGNFLDVGTATGAMAGVAKDFGYKAFGMDIHPIYRDNVGRFGAEFIEGSFTEHDFGKQKFDIVAFGDVLEHMIDVRKAMKVLDGILNKGGIVWISTPNYDCSWTRILGASDPMWLESEHLQYFSKDSLKKLLEDNGFKITDYNISKRYQGSIETIAERA